MTALLVRFPGITYVIKATTMIMHHKFCLVDSRELTQKELELSQKLKKKQDQKARMEPAAKKDKKEEEKANVKKVKLPSQGMLMTGSCNWTMQGFTGNWENIIVTSNTELVKEFQREFNGIFANFSQAINRSLGQ